MSEYLKIEWSAIAANDLIGIADYLIAAESVEISNLVCQRILDRIDTLASLPWRGRTIPEVRELSMKEFREIIVPPYRILYKIQKNKVSVIGVMDGRRNLRDTITERVLIAPEE